MDSAARLAVVLAIGFLFLGAVIGSIWLTQADALMTVPISVGGWTLPTPTLFPTVPPREPVLSRPTPTEVVASPEPEDADVTATPEEAKICEIPEGWIYYLVQPGDTFRSLAERAGTTLPALLDGNCIPYDYDLQAGEALYLPAPVLAAPTKTPFVCTKPWGWQAVIVRRGDTFSSLARRYGVALSLLLSMNCRDSSNTVLYAGQTIYVPPTVVVPPTWPPPPTWPILPTLVPTWPLPPTQTLPPPATSTPVPTDTPIPSPTPTPTETPVLVPTWTPTPPDWELPTPGPPPITPEPTATEMPAPIPTATSEATPTVTSTPEPTTGAPIVPAPLPTATGIPTPVPTNTWVPEPTATDPASSPVDPTPTTVP